MGQDGARREIRQAFHPSGASGVSIPGSGWGKLSMRHVCPAIFPFREYSPFSLQARTWNDFRASFPRHHPPVRNGVRVCGVIRRFPGRPIDDETT